MSKPQTVLTAVGLQQDNPYIDILNRQKESFKRRGVSTCEQRKEHLTRLQKAVIQYKDKLVEAAQSDFGHRSPHETLASEVLAVAGEAAAHKGKLKKWMKAQNVPFSLQAAGAQGKIIYQPKGVVGILGAWNYPVAMIFSPLVAVLGAGNHCMIKPPDLTPAVGEVAKELIANNFDEDHITVITGDVAVAAQFAELPFDHLMFTGGTSIGQKVMLAAARNLTPVTLEMGGKSPVIISRNYPISEAVDRLLMGKCVNSGQTCIAPDYILLPEEKQQEFVDYITASYAKRYPSLVNNQDITWIINDRHHKRVLGLIDDARKKGANVVQVNPKNEQIPDSSRVVPPTIITGVTDDMAVMQQEIFGPVLPIKTYKHISEAIQYVNDRPRPLALYYFDESKEAAEEVLSQTISGGACVNDTMLHIAHENLPFGGIGPSGLGRYHGFDGFVEFSHKKGVLYQNKRFAVSKFVKAPYPPTALKVMNYVSRFLG